MDEPIEQDPPRYNGMIRALHIIECFDCDSSMELEEPVRLAQVRKLGWQFYQPDGWFCPRCTQMIKRRRVKMTPTGMASILTKYHAPDEMVAWIKNSAYKGPQEAWQECRSYHWMCWLLAVSYQDRGSHLDYLEQARLLSMRVAKRCADMSKVSQDLYMVLNAIGDRSLTHTMQNKENDFAGDILANTQQRHNATRMVGGGVLIDGWAIGAAYHVYGMYVDGRKIMTGVATVLSYLHSMLLKGGQQHADVMETLTDMVRYAWPVVPLELCDNSRLARS